MYVSAACLRVGDVLRDGTRVTEIITPTLSYDLEVVTDDGNRVRWRHSSQVEIRWDQP